MATLMESLAAVTRGPELMAGSMPSLRKRKGRSRPRVVATMMAENMAQGFPVPRLQQGVDLFREQSLLLICHGWLSAINRGRTVPIICAQPAGSPRKGPLMST